MPVVLCLRGRARHPSKAHLGHVPHLFPGSHHSRVVHTTQGCTQKGKQSTLQPELTGPGDLLDEGVREGEHRWLLMSRLGTWVEVMPFQGNAGQGASLGGTCDQAGPAEFGCMRPIQVEMLNTHTQAAGRGGIKKWIGWCKEGCGTKAFKG